MLSSPLNLPKWCFVSSSYVIDITNKYRLEANSHLLKPPINNYCVYDKDVTVMVSWPLEEFMMGETRSNISARSSEAQTPGQTTMSTKLPNGSTNTAALCFSK